MTSLRRVVAFDRFDPSRRPRKTTQPGSRAPRVPRIARLVALALRFDELLRNGRVENLTALAKLAHVSQPRLTQILNLTLLAPDIIETLLHLRDVESGRETLHERALRVVASKPNWSCQRRLFDAISRRAGRRLRQCANEEEAGQTSGGNSAVRGR
jgi:hypothetical protein